MVRSDSYNPEPQPPNLTPPPVQQPLHFAIRASCLFGKKGNSLKFWGQVVRNSFIYIYFLTSNSFLPTNTHSPIHVLTFAMLSPHVFSLFILFHFTIHTKSKPSRTPAKSIQTFIEDRSYLLTRLFARHIFPPDTILQGFADQQPRRPLLHELVMRFYISRYQVQGDS